MNNKDEVSETVSTHNFHYRLRQETKNYHTQMESASLFKKIIDATITFDEYLQLIKKLYGYIEPCESLIHGSSSHSVLANREKTFLLEDDLQGLGVQKESLAKIPRCNHLSLLDEPEEVLGYLYVIEGSTLGGQVITKILQNKLNLAPENGVHYFYGYGKNTKARWQNFCVYLNEITGHEQQNKIIHSVNQTYQTLYDWVSNSQSF